MTYIELVNQFWNEHRVNRCDPYEIAVFFYILNEANKQHWEKDIKISTNILTAELGISRKTLIGTRKKLKDKNLIQFEPGLKNKQVAIYELYVSEGNIQRNIQGNIQRNIQGNIKGNYLNKSKSKIKINKENKEKINKVSKNKIECAEDVLLTLEEKNKLINNYSLNGYNRMIEILSNYKGASGKKYASDYKAIMSWVVNKYQQEKPSQSKKDLPVI